MIGHEIGDLKKHMPKIDSRVAAIFRKGESIVPTGSTVIEANDEVFFISKKGEASKVVNEMRKKEEPYKNIIIAGGGKIGARLAKRIESNHRVKIIESNNERAKRLSEKLENPRKSKNWTQKSLKIASTSRKMICRNTIQNCAQSYAKHYSLYKRLGILENLREYSISGNPRFDLTSKSLRNCYKKEVSKINKKYGAKCLINKNKPNNVPSSLITISIYI